MKIITEDDFPWFEVGSHNLFRAAPPPTCSGKTMKGTKCKRRAKFITPTGNFCLCHLPLEFLAILKKKEEVKQQKLDEAVGLVESRIKEVYENFANIRRVPPPEIIAGNLLRYLQKGQCFMCWACGRSQRAEVEDHSHRTGMVRALLCKSCNTKEGMAGARRPWLVYRESAPANGWYYRFMGWGEQWHPEDSDPLSSRITESDLGISTWNIRHIIERGHIEYLNKLHSFSATDMSMYTHVEFDILGNPVTRKDRT